MQHLTCQASSASSVRQKAFGVFRAFLTFCPFWSSLKRHGLKRMLRQSLHHFASFHIRSLVPYFSFTIDWLGSTHSWRSFCRKKQRILPPAGQVQQFLTGIRHDPPYPPNLEALLKVGTIRSLGRCRGPARQSYSEIRNMALVFDRFCIDADSWDLLRSLAISWDLLRPCRTNMLGSNGVILSNPLLLKSQMLWSVELGSLLNCSVSVQLYLQLRAFGALLEEFWLLAGNTCREAPSSCTFRFGDVSSLCRSWTCFMMPSMST